MPTIFCNKPREPFLHNIRCNFWERIGKMAHAGPQRDEFDQERAFNQNASTTIDDRKPEDNANATHNKWDSRHFKILKTVGKGNYATVYLVQSLQTQQLYAMKVRGKKFLHENSEISSIGTEKEILLLARKAQHPFVVEVFGGFQTQSKIMFFLEFCQGGDLMHHINAGEQFDLKRGR
jgi:serine/threonine protein kinase